jgi:hypothetical protein
MHIFYIIDLLAICQEDILTTGERAGRINIEHIFYLGD